MTNPAFIIEGHLEKLFLSSICPGRKVLKLEVNGRDVALEAIVKRIESFAVLFHGKYYPIIIVFDREGRSESASNIAKLVLERLKEKRPSDAFIVGVADRMIENWILADWGNLKQSISHLPSLPTHATEGVNGKAILRRLLGSEKYSATIQGPKLLKQARATEIEKQSASFKAFKEQLLFDCAWLNR